MRIFEGHPATCGGNRTDDAHKRYAEDHGEEDFGILVNGVCPVCGWKQPKDIGTQLHEAKIALAELLEIGKEAAILLNYSRFGGKWDNDDVLTEITFRSMLRKHGVVID